MINCKEIYWCINNLKGKSVRIERKDQKTVKHFNLGDWDNVLAMDETCELSFSEKNIDINTEVYGFAQRYYDPKLGGVIYPDPAKQLVNQYVYAGNKAIDYTDPEGAWFWTRFWY